MLVTVETGRLTAAESKKQKFLIKLGSSRIQNTLIEKDRQTSYKLDFTFSYSYSKLVMLCRVLVTSDSCVLERINTMYLLHMTSSELVNCIEHTGEREPG